MKKFRFEQLNVWHETREFVNMTYSYTKKFPEEERFCLTSQMRRAALSVLLNISEGADRGSDKEFVRFLHVANASLQEVIAASYIAEDQKYITQIERQLLHKAGHMISKKINALIRYLKK